MQNLGLRPQDEAHQNRGDHDEHQRERHEDDEHQVGDRRDEAPSTSLFTRG